MSRHPLVLPALLCAAMLATTVLGHTLRPQAPVAAVASVHLAAMVPLQFGPWTVLPDDGRTVINPDTQKTLDKIYSQVLTRTYTDREGYQIMLSLAYGKDQRRSLAAHRPDVCYPAQGFKVEPAVPVTLATDFGGIQAERMLATLGPRVEPVTFWFTVGDKVVRGALERRVVGLRYALTGEIPDGLLFRVSSIDPDPAHAYWRQDTFVRELLGALAPEARIRLAGLR